MLFLAIVLSFAEPLNALSPHHSPLIVASKVRVQASATVLLPSSLCATLTVFENRFFVVFALMLMLLEPVYFVPLIVNTTSREPMESEPLPDISCAVTVILEVLFATLCELTTHFIRILSHEASSLSIVPLVAT